MSSYMISSKMTNTKVSMIEDEPDEIETLEAEEETEEETEPKRLLVNKSYDVIITDQDNVIRAKIRVAYCDVLETNGINVKTATLKNGVHMDIY